MPAPVSTYRPTAPVGSRFTAHSSLAEIASFSAKERDTETGLSYFGARYYSSDLSIWLSVDPMRGKYPSLSPYTYCADNPVKLVDPNGDTVRITGDGAEAVAQQLQNQTSEGFKLELADGILSFSGEAKTDIDLMIAEAILSENITVNIEAHAGFNKDFGNGFVIQFGGGYGGSTYANGKVSTRQCVCPQILALHDRRVGDSKPGLTMVHELAESYYGGVIAMEKRQGSPDSRYDGTTYKTAHERANRIAIGDFTHYPLFWGKIPDNMSDAVAKILFPYRDIWKRGLEN